MSGHHTPGRKHRGALAAALGLTASFAVVEAVTGILTGGLVLLADAGHMAADVFALLLALGAVQFAQRPPDDRRTYGYHRAEILAALANGVLLLGVSAYVLLEATVRFRDPVNVDAAPLMIVATIGLGVNIIAMRLLTAGAVESLNVRAAMLEVVADALGSIAAVAAGIIILTTGWRYADPIFAAGVALLIWPRAWHIIRSALDVLFESAPRDIAMEDVQSVLAGPPEVIGVHDLHVWTLTSGYHALSAHVHASADADCDVLLAELRRRLHERFAIDHVTLQIEHPVVEAVGAEHMENCRSEITHEDHPHVHSEGCGHPAVVHAGHVDYVHDGHAHAAHAGHWDEH